MWSVARVIAAVSQRWPGREAATLPVPKSKNERMYEAGIKYEKAQDAHDKAYAEFRAECAAIDTEEQP